MQASHFQIAGTWRTPLELFDASKEQKRSLQHG